MSKRVFDSSLSDPVPSAAGADTEDDDDADPDEDESSPDEDEQPPSKTSKGNGQAPAAKQRGPNRTREWKEFNWWSRSDNSDAEIMSFIRADLAELNKKAGITSLPPRECGHTYTACRLVRHNASTVSRHSALARPLSGPSDVP